MKDKLLMLFACMFLYVWQVGAQTVVTEATTWDLTEKLDQTSTPGSLLEITPNVKHNSKGYYKFAYSGNSTSVAVNYAKFTIPAGVLGTLKIVAAAGNTNGILYVATSSTGDNVDELHKFTDNKVQHTLEKQYPLQINNDAETNIYIYAATKEIYIYSITWIPESTVGEFIIDGDPNIIASGTWNEDEFNTYVGTIGADKVTSVNLNGVSDFNGTLPLSTVTNPNCLYYVTSAMYEAASDKKNLVSDDKAEVKTGENIVLADGNPFLNQVDFTATAASYTRTFTAAGTYSICLPFAVESIPGEVTVLEYKGSNGAKVNFSQVSAMAANTPYLVEVSADNINKEIKFEAANITVEASASVSVADAANNAYTFNSNFEPFTTTAAQGLYLLEAGGAGFVKAGTASVGSFRAYIAPVSNEPAKAPRLVIGNDEGGATGIDASEAISRELSIYSAGGVLELNSPVAQRVKVYGVDGCLVRVLQLSEGNNVVSGLAKGMYIIANRKVVIK